MFVSCISNSEPSSKTAMLICLKWLAKSNSIPQQLTMTSSNLKQGITFIEAIKYLHNVFLMNL